MEGMAEKAGSRRQVRSQHAMTQWLFRPYWKRVRVQALTVGDRVYVSSSSHTPGSKDRSGFLRFWGKIHCAAGYWAGLELDLPHGQNDGSLDGRRYFLCSPNRGLFVRAGRCRARCGYGGSDRRYMPSPTEIIRKTAYDVCHHTPSRQYADGAIGAGVEPTSTLVSGTSSAWQTKPLGARSIASLRAAAGQPPATSQVACKLMGSGPSTEGPASTDTSGLNRSSSLPSAGVQSAFCKAVRGHAWQTIRSRSYENLTERQPVSGGTGRWHQVSLSGPPAQIDSNQALGEAEAPTDSARPGMARRRVGAETTTVAVSRSNVVRSGQYANTEAGGSRRDPQTSIDDRHRRQDHLQGHRHEDMAASFGGASLLEVVEARATQGEATGDRNGTLPDKRTLVPASTFGRCGDEGVGKAGLSTQPVCDGDSFSVITPPGSPSSPLCLMQRSSLVRPGLAGGAPLFSSNISSTQVMVKASPNPAGVAERSLAVVVAPSARYAAMGIASVVHGSVCAKGSPPSAQVVADLDASTASSDYTTGTAMPTRWKNRGNERKNSEKWRSFILSFSRRRQVDISCGFASDIRALAVPQERFNFYGCDPPEVDAGKTSLGHGWQSSEMENESATIPVMISEHAGSCRDIVVWTRPIAADDSSSTEHRARDSVGNMARQGFGLSPQQAGPASIAKYQASISREVRDEEGHLSENAEQEGTSTLPRCRRSGEIDYCALIGLKLPTMAWPMVRPSDSCMALTAMPTRTHLAIPRKEAPRQQQVTPHRYDGGPSVSGPPKKLDVNLSGCADTRTVGMVDSTTLVGGFPAPLVSAVKGAGTEPDVAVRGKTRNILGESRRERTGKGTCAHQHTRLGQESGGKSVAIEYGGVARTSHLDAPEVAGMGPIKAKQFVPRWHVGEEASYHIARSSGKPFTLEKPVQSLENEERRRREAAPIPRSKSEFRPRTSIISARNADKVIDSQNSAPAVSGELAEKYSVRPRRRGRDAGIFVPGDFPRDTDEAPRQVGKEAVAVAPRVTTSVDGFSPIYSESRASQPTRCPPIPLPSYPPPPSPPTPWELPRADEPTMREAQGGKNPTQVVREACGERIETSSSATLPTDMPVLPVTAAFSVQPPPSWPLLLTPPLRPSNRLIVRTERTRSRVDSSLTTDTFYGTNLDEDPSFQAPLRVACRLRHGRRERARRNCAPREPIVCPSLSTPIGSTTTAKLVPTATAAQMADTPSDAPQLSPHGNQQQRGERTVVIAPHAVRHTRVETGIQGRHRRRYPPPPGPPPSPSLAITRTAVQLTGDVPPSQRQSTALVGERFGERGMATGKDRLRRNSAVPSDDAITAPFDDFTGGSHGPCRAFHAKQQAVDSQGDIILDLAGVEMPWLPLPTPPPVEARRRARRPSMAMPSAADAGAGTPLSPSACAGRGKDTTSERVSDWTKVTNFPPDRRPISAANVSANRVEHEPTDECTSPWKGETVATKEDGDTHTDARGGPPPGLAGDGLGTVGGEPAAGSWGSSCAGVAAKRRANEILARVAALEASFGHVEEYAQDTLRASVASSVGLLSDGIEHARVNTPVLTERGRDVTATVTSATTSIHERGVATEGAIRSDSSSNNEAVRDADPAGNMLGTIRALGDRLPVPLAVSAKSRVRQEIREESFEPRAAAQTDLPIEPRYDIEPPAVLGKANVVAEGRGGGERKAEERDGCGKEEHSSFYFNLGRSMVLGALE